MKSPATLLAILLIAIAGPCAAPLIAAEKSVTDEPLGKIALGQKADDLVKLLGKPEAKGKDTEWAATGEWVEEWKYPAQGLRINMASGKKGGAKTVSTITATTGCKLATARGITIGSPVAAVRKAYGKLEDKEQGGKGDTFVAGSVYGGVIFTLKAGKVAGIFIGAAAE